MIISFAKPSVTIPPSLEWVGMGWLPPPLGSLNMDIDCPYFFLGCIDIKWASLVAQLVKNLGAMRETWVQSLDWEDPLEDGMATHSRWQPTPIYFPGESPWTKEPGMLQSMGSQRVGLIE